MKSVTATLASLSLAVGLAAPTSATADENDLAKIIGGIAAIAIIAELADRKRDRDRANSSATIRQNIVPQDRAVSRSGSWGWIDGDRNRPNATRGYRSLPLPGHCERTVETRRGDRLVYGARCLDRRYKHARHLPQSCQVLVNTERGQRIAYTSRCLRRDGWITARR